MTTQTMPAGTYYIGDLCYQINNDTIWQEMCNSHLADGVHTLNGMRFFWARTAYGDGHYISDCGDGSFGVDSGTIGCVLVEHCDDDGEDGGLRRTFSNEFEVSSSDGVFTIGDLRIDTNWDE